MNNPGSSAFDLSKSNASIEYGGNYGSKRSKTFLIIAAVLILTLLVAVIVLAVLYVDKENDSDTESNTSKIIKGTTAEPTSQTSGPTTKTSETTISPVSQSTANPLPNPPANQGPYKNAAVAADDVRCSEIGVDILKRNGTAVDAAVAAMFCIGVINMHSAGIGGGAVMVVYNRTGQTSEYFNFREKAPANASRDMFVNKTGASSFGGLAIAVPGEVRGMYEAHKKYGKLEWKELVKPAIKLAREGFVIHEALDKAIRAVESKIRKMEGMSELLVTEDNRLKKLGDNLVNRKLAITLERIANDPTSFYNGSLAEDIAADISTNQGIITEKDLNDYNVEIEPALDATIGDLKLFTTGLPSSGILIAFMLNVLEGYNFQPEDLNDPTRTASAYHRIIETFRYAYARRALLGDKNFANVTEISDQLLNKTYAEMIRKKITNETYQNVSHYGGYYSNYDAPGTSHLSVLAPNGDAVSVTSTINTYFGSNVRSTVTGIVYNNEMDDFSTPGQVNAYGVEPSPSNFIRPGKRPMSSMSPVIVTNSTSGDVLFIAGASGGTRITTGTALATMFKLWFGRTTSEAVTRPRFHNQLLPNYTAVEESPYNMPADIVKDLESYGHDVKTRSYKCVIQAIAREWNGTITAKSDPRKGGYSDGY